MTPENTEGIFVGRETATLQSSEQMSPFFTGKSSQVIYVIFIP